MSVGGAVKYSAITGQPIKVGGGGNVSSMGQLDMNALISYEASNIMNELLASRSDHHKIKRKMYSEIAQSGQLYEPTEEDRKMDSSGGTSDLKDTYMLALGLATRK